MAAYRPKISLELTLLLTEGDVDRLLDMPAAMQAVEEVFRLQGTGQAHNLPRRRVGDAQAVLHIMGAAIPAVDRIGYKAYVTGPGGARFLVSLYRASTSELLALIEAGRLGQLRTGAASGISAKYLARKDARVACLIGSGYQARTQLEGVARACNLSAVRVYSRNVENRRRFARDMSASLNLEVTPSDSPQAAADGADVIITATNSAQPVVKGDWLPPGSHVIAMGANRIGSRELDDAAIESFDLITVDDIEQAKIEAGDLAEPVSRGLVKWEQVIQLAGVVAGTHGGRTNDAQRTLFKSLGIALWDVAAANHVYEEAKRAGAGVEMALGNP